MAEQPPGTALDSPAVGTGNGTVSHPAQTGNAPPLPVYPIQASVTIVTPKEQSPPEPWFSVKKIEAITALLKVAAWPIIVILLMVLFYSPVNSILMALPSKVEDSSKITVGSLTLEIQQAARAAGNPELAALIGNLSPRAVEELLKIQLDGNWVYVSAEPDFKRLYPTPEDKKLALAELNKAGLVEFDLPLAEFDKFFADLPLKNELPGVKTGGGIYVSTRPLTEAEKTKIRSQDYRLTEQGKKAYTLILEGVKQSLNKHAEGAGGNK